MAISGASLPRFTDFDARLLLQHLNELAQQVEDRLRDIESRLDNLVVQNHGEEPMLNAEFRTVPLVWADGTGWDPGSGAGLYALVAGSWVKV
jgi:hypothetical protein